MMDPNSVYLVTLPLATRTLRLCARENVATLADAISRSDAEWLRAPYCGRKTLNNLKETIAAEYPEIYQWWGIEDRNGWRPIWTAPTDGTKIMLWDRMRYRIAHRWESYWIDECDGMPLILPPTHWRPLPDPPNK